MISAIIISPFQTQRGPFKKASAPAGRETEPIFIIPHIYTGFSVSAVLILLPRREHSLLIHRI
ncbi:MAG TPA: hypothetical protein DHW82_13895 [Spirochaetia bacterium]|nr:hypothetical protein [Spirochaetia bacterium]